MVLLPSLVQILTWICCYYQLIVAGASLATTMILKLKTLCGLYLSNFFTQVYLLLATYKIQLLALLNCHILYQLNTTDTLHIQQTFQTS